MGVLVSAVGLIAVYVVLARGIDRRAGAYGVVVLATMPPWFAHARTAGAIAPMTGCAAALAGAFVAFVDPRARTPLRAGALAVSIAGAVVAARAGGVVVIAPVAIGVGAGALLAGRRRSGAALVASGAAVAVATVARASGATTFEAPLTELAYALAPWSPLVPFALVRRPRSPAQLAACASAVAALVVQAGLAPRAPLAGAPFVALAIAAMLRDLDDQEQASTLLAAAIFTVGALVVRDLGLGPERVLTALGVQLDRAAAGSVPALRSAANAVRVAMWILLVGATGSLLLSNAMLGLRRLRFARGMLLAASGAIAGGVVRLHAWPVLLAVVTPDAALDAYLALPRTELARGAGVLPRREVR